MVASGSEGNTDPELKNDTLMREFQKLLRYKNYQLLDSAMVRALDGEYSQINFGPNNQFTLYLKPKVSEEASQVNINLQVNLNQIKVQEVLSNNQIAWINISTSPLSLISSQLYLKSKDRAVVGTSRLEQHSSSPVNNKGLILIITGKVLD